MYLYPRNNLGEYKREGEDKEESSCNLPEIDE